MSNPLSVLMVAAENDGISHCKVGGIGDVIRDIPAALAEEGCRVSIVTPSYGYLHQLPGTLQAGSVSFLFGGRSETADLYTVRPRKGSFERATHYVIDHPLFLNYNTVKEQFDIYSDDPAGRPFATDATKFACFNAAVAAAVKANLFGELNVLHLHDWHAAFLLMLRKYDPNCAGLQQLRTAYTIHNLALQGVRPIENDPSSLRSWYPHILFEKGIPEELRDPRWEDCINPMAVGIRLADAVHTVSPTYAGEIVQKSRPPQYFGGEGLEGDLRQAMESGRLHGILNGCEYPEHRVPRLSTTELIRLLKRETARWTSKRTALTFADSLAFQRLEKLERARKKPGFIAVSISRAVEQKLLLLKAERSDGHSGLEKILAAIGKSGLYILLGTGDRKLEEFLTELSALHSNFIFLNSYSNAVAEVLYTSGDLFLMPSSFEPCGIGQMLAMREGQPCLVNRTGGLRDTVKPGSNGFGFEGESLEKQVDAMETELKKAVALYKGNPDEWNRICNAAAETRFLWTDSAREYIDKLYS